MYLEVYATLCIRNNVLYGVSVIRIRSLSLVIWKLRLDGGAYLDLCNANGAIYARQNGRNIAAMALKRYCGWRHNCFALILTKVRFMVKKFMLANGNGIALSDGLIITSLNEQHTTCIANFGQDSSFAGNKTPQGNQDC